VENMPTDFALRTAVPGDLEVVLDLIRGLYATDHIELVEERARRSLAGLLADPSLGEVWLIESRSQVIGYAVLTLGYSLEFGGRFWVLDEFFLRDEHRGQGAGRQALREIEAAARARGLHAVRLEVGRTNLRAQALYERAGFEAHDRDLMTMWIDEIEETA
jgi:ribosomal protein S18 acetylase RimI-like enzyme